jgi:YVTN family beta-propeller protein
MRTVTAALVVCRVAAAIAAAAPPALIAVVNRGENSVSLIDPSGNTPTAKLPTGPGPHEAAACGTRILVSNYGAQTPGSTISVYDGSLRRQVATIDVAPLLRPHGMVCAGDFAYFTAETNLVIGRIRLSDNKLDLIIGTGQKIGHMIATPASAAAFFTSNLVSGTVAKIAKAAGPGGWDVTAAKVGQTPEAIAVSPDGAQVWAGNRGDSTISVVDAAAMKTLETFSTEKFVFRLGFTHDGKRVLATEPESDAVLVFDAATRKLLHTIAIPGAPVSIAIGADDRLAYVVAAGAGKVVEIDLEKYAAVRDFATGTGPDGIALMDPVG